METPQGYGTQIEMVGMPEDIKVYEDAAHVYLWCATCLMMEPFTSHATQEELIIAANAHQHVINEWKPPEWERDWVEGEEQHFDRPIKPRDGIV